MSISTSSSNSIAAPIHTNQLLTDSAKHYRKISILSVNFLCSTPLTQVDLTSKIPAHPIFIVLLFSLTNSDLTFHIGSLVGYSDLFDSYLFKYCDSCQTSDLKNLKSHC